MDCSEVITLNCTLLYLLVALIITIDCEQAQSPGRVIVRHLQAAQTEGLKCDDSQSANL